MGERKVLNKYFPPDFDPAKLPRGKKAANNEMKVRMMLPMSLRCATCGAFMYKGTKFNTRKEDVAGEKYLDAIQVFRFYFRCSTCSAEITFKTDPKNNDYVAEHGASRNYEPWREADAARKESAAAREEEERGNAMKALENKALDSRREMDLLNALDEMRSIKARHEQVGIDAALDALRRSAADEGGEGEGEEGAAAGGELDEEDEEALRQLFHASRAAYVKRLPTGEPADAAAGPGPSSIGGDDGDGAAAKPAPAKPAPAKPLVKPLVVVKAKRRADAPLGGGPAKQAKAAEEQESSGGGLAGLAGYGSSGSGSGSGSE